MSYSETVTKEDLKNVLNEVLPSPTLNPWALLDASGFTGNNTATKVTGTTTQSGGSASEYFDTSTPDQITIKKAGLYKVTCAFGLSATSNVSNVKRISCYVNGSESAVAMSRTQSWENVMSFVTRTYSKDDVLTMYRRAEDGNSTYSQATILVEALHASSGNVRAEADYIVEQGTSGIWAYRKWNSGIAECWGQTNVESTTYTANGGYKNVVETLPSGLFNATPPTVLASGSIDSVIRTMIGYTSADNATQVQTYLVNMYSSAVTKTGKVSWHIIGTWK